MKKCDLQTIYAELAFRLPTQDDGNENIILSSENLPVPPSEMATNNLYISKAKHNYNNWFEVDTLWFFAQKETYRYLGLLILSVVFHPQVEQVKVNLNHPNSEIESLTIEEYYPRKINELPSGFHSIPFAFVY